MSTKRTAAESNNDELTTDGSDPVSQQQSDAKRAKLASLSDTTLEDLPIELLKCILVEVVTMEVKNMKFAKSVWKKKASLVINRLCTVCSQWSNICATKYFRTEVHRTLDSNAQKTIRFEMLYQYPIQSAIFRMTAVKDEIFLICLKNGEVDNIISVFDCNNMAEVKDVIPLPGIYPESMAGCSVSNCVYIHNAEEDQTIPDSVLRITRAEEHHFTISLWITTDQKLSLLTVSANGDIITISEELRPNPAILSIYAANGSLLHKVVLCPDIYEFTRVENVIQRSNRNLVLVLEMTTDTAELLEIDTFGIVVRRYQSSLSPCVSVVFADIHGRILITNWESRFELLDSEFNLLDVTGVQPKDSWIFLPHQLRFNSERNEIMSMLNCVDPTKTFGFASFRFVSE